MLSTHVTRFVYKQICLTSKDVVAWEIMILICSRYDKLKGIHGLSLVENYQHSINS